MTAFTVLILKDTLHAERDSVFTMNDVIEVVTSEIGFSSNRASVSSFSLLASDMIRK